jgi:hypothetical protein
MSLYEGTNGIQSMDLMGRKMRINQGAPFRAFMKELEDFSLGDENDPLLGDSIRTLGQAVLKLKATALALAEKSSSDPLQWAASTYPALICFGDIIMAWRLLDLALIARRRMEEEPENEFYLGKIFQATYWTGTILPETMARLETCLREGREVIEIPDGAF